MTGRFLGEFEVVRVLGQGGMGSVYEVRVPGDPRRLALKRIHVTNPRTVERFRREGELAARLDHPNVVAVRGAGVLPDASPYLLFDLIEGPTLHDLLRERGRLPEPEALRYAKQIAAGLAHAHARGVVHRDLKPANLLQAEDGRIVLADFGLAVAEDMERMTRTGQLVGTPLYFAPEQINDRERVGPATDVHAFGAILHELLTGAPPFLGSDSNLFEAILKRAPSSVRAERPEVSRGLSEVISRCLQKDPAQRYPDGAALLEALEGLERGGGRSPALLAGALAGGVLVGALCWAFAGQSPAVDPTTGATPTATAAPAPAASPADAPSSPEASRAYLPRWRPPLGSERVFHVEFSNKNAAVDYRFGWRAVYRAEQVTERRVQLRVTIQAVKGKMKSSMVGSEVDSSQPAPKVLQGMHALRKLVGRGYTLVITDDVVAKVRGARATLQGVLDVTGRGLVRESVVPSYFTDRGLSTMYTSLLVHLPRQPKRQGDRWQQRVLLHAPETLVGPDVKARVQLDCALTSADPQRVAYTVRSKGDPLWVTTNASLTAEMRRRITVEVDAVWNAEGPVHILARQELGPAGAPADQGRFELQLVP